MNRMYNDDQFKKIVSSKFLDFVNKAKYKDHENKQQLYLDKEKLIEGMKIMMYKPEDSSWKLKEVSELQLSDINKLFAWLYTIPLESVSESEICIASYYDLCSLIASYEKKIPTGIMESKDRVTDETEDEFIRSVINSLARLYNETDKNGNKFARCMKKCVEIFWEYGVWTEKHCTMQCIYQLHELLRQNPISYASGLTFGVANRFNNLTQYTESWIESQAQKQKSTPKSTPDINTRVEELEKEVQELRSQVQALIFNNPPEFHGRESLLQKLDRLT